jgi:protein-L-isoaspartate(D-aspartate) O-methyltransferase
MGGRASPEMRYRVLIALTAAGALAGACGWSAGNRAQPAPATLTKHMIDSQLRARGLRNARVLEAMARVPRHRFIPDEFRAEAYADTPVPIGFGQTISQPYVVGYMTDLLDPQPTDRVLEIGTGSGYQAAVLAELAGEVYSIEIVDTLAERAKATLADLGYRNIHVRAGDGYKGWPEAAPFQKIILTAAPPSIPPALVDQLADGGMLVAPVGPASDVQTLVVLRKTPDGVKTDYTIPVRFVPMVSDDSDQAR